MSWNDPGNRSQDPWGDRGPPDLDDAFRKLKAQFGSTFGGSGDSGAGKSKKFFQNRRFWGFLLLVLVLGWAALGIYTVDQQERGVVFRFGKVQHTLTQPGLRWNPPIVDVVEKVNVTRVNSLEHSSQMLTEDENIVAINLVVQYKVSEPIKHVVDIRNPRQSLENATESALRHVVGSSAMDAVITEGREALAFEVQDRLQNYIDLYQTGINVFKVNIDSVGPPGEVQDAFDDVQKAKEDEVRFRNEANAYLEQVVPEARGEAQRMIENANAYREEQIANARGEADRFTKLLAEYQLAKDVTRTRLYLEAIEAVYANSGKVMVDVGQSLNVLNLPLDQLQKSMGDGPARQAADRALETLSGTSNRTGSTGRGETRRTGR